MPIEFLFDSVDYFLNQVVKSKNVRKLQEVNDCFTRAQDDVLKCLI